MMLGPRVGARFLWLVASSVLASACGGSRDPSGAGAGATASADGSAQGNSSGNSSATGSGSGGTSSSSGATASSNGGAANGTGAATSTSGGGAGVGGAGGNGGNGGNPNACPPLDAEPLPVSVKVDLDMAGRPESEVSEIGYVPWPSEDADTISRTLEGIEFTFTRVGSQGTALASDWAKTLIQAPYYARLVSDGLTVEGGEAGGEIELRIAGLAAGSHSLVVYHNNTQNPANNTFAPIDISIDGTLVVDDLVPSVQVEQNSLAETSFLEFEAEAGVPVVFRFAADTSTDASNKNVMLNGFELDTPNPALQAQDPAPAHRDEHVDADDGTQTLSWSAAAGAVAHRVYFGEAYEAVALATPESCEFRAEQAGTRFDVTGLSSLGTYYWRIDEVGDDGIVTRGNVWDFRPRQLAFPGAEGYGRYARGGRRGSIVHVTNLGDAGAGSFREAIENDIGPRTIVFDVGGTIALESRLSLTSSHVTVAGQTAPGKGICVRGAPFGLSGASDVVVQHVRVRLGAGPTFDGMGMSGSDHSIIDRSSISWTIDEAFSSRSGKNITLQRTLISECLNVAGHQNYDPGTAHGYAASISGDIGSFHHNLLAHCEGRNFSLAGGLDGDGLFAGRLDIFNNVVYNWRSRATDGGAHEVNFVGNYYKPGAATTLFVALNAQYEEFPGTQQYYFAGNVMPGHFDESNQNAGRTYSGTPNGYNPWVDQPFFPSYATVQSADDAYKQVLSDVGASQPALDDHDSRVIRETLEGTTTYAGSETGYPGLPDHENDVGGYEDYPSSSREAGWDSDDDGLPDFWELALGLDPNSSAGDASDSHGDPDGDGFTRLDDYLQWMAGPHAFVPLGSSLEVDLQALFAGFSAGPSYAAHDLAGVSAEIAGATATLTPSECGFAGADLTVSDGSGATMTQRYALFVDGC